ncbi:MAG: NAD-dependent epimerase/dehydratase family protein [Planctomycetota bacterium]
MSKGQMLITGASGMVGSLLIPRALEAGYQVRAMVRSAAGRKAFEGQNVEIVEGDLARPETLPGALADMNVVVHAAAHVGDWGTAADYRACNVVALEHMATAAARNDQFRLWIQVSSLGVYPAQHHYGTTEETPCDPQGLDGYTRTKAEAEVLLNRHMRQHGFPAIILRPGFMYGPGDRHIVPSLIERIQAGQMKLIGDGKKLLNNTYVGNLLDAILLAAEREDCIGETFNIRDERLVTREEFVGAVADYLGKPRPGHVPEWLARAAVGPIESFARLRGATKAPLLTKARIKFLALNLDFSIAKAKERLGYRPRVDFSEGIRETLDWAKEAGLIWKHE